MRRTPLVLGALLAAAAGALFGVPAFVVNASTPQPAHTGRALATKTPPAPSFMPPAGPPQTPSGAASASPPPAATNDADGAVTPGAFCAEPGGTGQHAGVTYTCKGPGRLRWRL